MPIKATIKRWYPMRGFGFASCDNSAEPDFFVHICDASVKFLHIGDRIECEVETRERGPIGKQIKVLSFAS